MPRGEPEKSLDDKFEEWMGRNDYGLKHNANTLAVIAKAWFLAHGWKEPQK